MSISAVQNKGPDEHFIHGLSFKHWDTNQFLSSFLFYGPLVESVVDAINSISLASARLVGPFWMDRRKARLALRQLEAAIERYKAIWDGLPDEMARFYLPSDPASDEVARAEAEKALSRTYSGARMASGI